MSSPDRREFSKLRSIFWPIHRHELKKIVPMLLLFFCISFNYTILRDTKDTIIVTSSGAEAITFVKFWGVIPSAILFMVIYSKLTNILSKQNVFYVIVTSFIIFFAVFALFLYPARDILHPHEAADSLQSMLPQGFGGLIGIFRNWTFALFYILSELWGSVVLSLLFWSFANDITKVTEAKRFYALFGIGANVALMVSGPVIIHFSKIHNKVPYGVDPWGVTLNYLMSFVVISGVIIMLIYRWINRNVLSDPRFYDETQFKKSSKSKPKMSIVQSFRYIFQSSYLGCIALIVIGYGTCINFIEISWKAQLKLQYPSANEYNAFMGGFSFVTGVVTVILMLFVAHNILRKFGWTVGAIITPAILLLTGIGFFGFVIFRDNLAGFISVFGATPLMLAVIIGAAQNILSKATKYSLFDPTKEMAYIPLDDELKFKGKAAVDVVGARLGKSTASLIQQGLIVSMGSVVAITPYSASLVFVMIIIWVSAAKILGKKFNALVSDSSSIQV